MGPEGEGLSQKDIGELSNNASKTAHNMHITGDDSNPYWGMVLDTKEVADAAAREDDARNRGWDGKSYNPEAPAGYLAEEVGKRVAKGMGKTGPIAEKIATVQAKHQMASIEEHQASLKKHREE